MSQIRHLRPSLTPLSLRLIHSGRLLTDGILLIPWLRSLEDRLRRQASTMGGDVESVLKEVGLAEDESSGSTMGSKSSGEKKQEEERVWLHCIVGGKLDEKKVEEGAEEEVSLLFMVVLLGPKLNNSGDCTEKERVRRSY